jgi:hypothetical protein
MAGAAVAKATPIPAWIRLAGGAAAWGLAMTFSVALSLHFTLGRALNSQFAEIAAIYFVGAMLAFPLAATFPRLMPSRWPLWLRLAACVVVLGLATLAMTAAILALQYRAYYAQWHDPALSRVWFWQQFFTILGSTFQFSVIGLRLYWPAGPLFLLLASWWLARREH